ncbi:MAG: FAD-dependent oxidoreductase [Anaerolineaceae bacterium]|nr:FAD-dependent oxidoreductase [Anaerolineaceae bacterium]
MTTYTALIVGGGAAGLAAARRLHDAGERVLVLEARNRIGGRVDTDYLWDGFPLERGAEFIHGENAVTHDLVRQAGLDVIPVVRMDNLWWSDGQTPARHRDTLPPALRETINRLLTDYAALEQANLPTDISLADYLRGRGWTGDDLHMADVLLAQTCCAALETLSCADLRREMQLDHAGYDEARIRHGYGALLQWYSRDLPIRLNTPVETIQWSPSGVTVYAGTEVFNARHCIITVPVSLLQAGTIRFDPPLPEEKRRAIAAFRVEAATKLVYRFQEQVWGDDLTYMAHTGTVARWWTPDYKRGQLPVIAAYLTAERARTVDTLPEDAALALGLQELSTLLGIQQPDLQRMLISGKRISWATDPLARGGYAHLPPGAADARPLLAASVDGDVLHFAGEATAYDTNPQTVHGAIESGWRTAQSL